MKLAVSEKERQEDRQKVLLLGLFGPWRFYEKADSVADWKVRYQIFRSVTFNTSSRSLFQKAYA